MLAAGILATGWIGVRDHWNPVGDNAMITTFSLDTISSDPPLLGMPTSLSLLTGDPVRHPGPLPFWLIGPPAKLLGAPGYGVIVGVVGIQLAALASMIVATRRMPRSVGAFAAAFSSVMVVRGVGLRSLRDPFNPYLGIFPGLAALLAAWAVVAGHLWVLPVFVAIASFIAQTHVTFLPLVGGLVLVVLAVLIADHRRLPPDHPRRALLLRRVGPLSLLVGLACWSGPLYDQLFGTGNLWALVMGGADVEVVGWRYGLERLVGGVSPLPLWAEPAHNAGRLASPSLLRNLLGATFLALLGIQAAWAWRARHRALFAGTVVAGGALVAAATISARLPSDGGALRSPLNRIFWIPVGCMAWLVVAWGTWAIARSVLHHHRPEVARRLPLRAAGAAVASLVCLIALTTGTDTRSPISDNGSIVFGAARMHGDAVERAVPAGSTILLRSPGTDLDNVTFTQTMIAHLSLRGYVVQLEVNDPWGYWRTFQSRHPADGTHDATILIHGAPADPPGGYVVLSTYDPDDPPKAFAEHRRGVLFRGGFEVSTLYIYEETEAAAE